tara:strand:- start:36 stop:278 length:243 start_codon:yes stop_codon:yes gene_type:complete
MHALCLIRARPGMVDNVVKTLFSKKHSIIKEIMPVTGRADICVILHSSIDKINTTVIGFNKIKNIVSTETLVELEVDMGW